MYNESQVFLQAKSNIQGDKPPVMKNKKCEDNFPEVGTAQKNKVENTVNFITVSDMTVMFEQNLKIEDNTQKIQRITTGRQHRQGDPEKSQDNIDNFVAAQDQILENSSNLNHKGVGHGSLDSARICLCSL